MAAKSKAFFNSTSKAKNIFYLLTYIKNKDLFSRKLKIDLLKAYDKNTESVSFFISLKAAHLLRHEHKDTFVQANKVIFDMINLKDHHRETLLDDLIICTDNASNALTIFYELNRTTSTITLLSTVKPPEEQLTTHVRSSITRTHYLPGEAKIFNAKSSMYANDLYSLETMVKLNNDIDTSATAPYFEDTVVSSAYIPVPTYATISKELWDLLKSEAVESISKLTGLEKRNETINNYESNSVFVRRDKDGFHITLG